MRVFLRGANVCCVLVKAGLLDGESEVTLLHKQGAVY